VAGVLAGHETAAGRGAYGAAGVGLGEANAFGGEAADVRGADALLAIAFEVAEAEVVGEDEEDVGAGGGWLREGGGGGGGAEEVAASHPRQSIRLEDAGD
jgi:hypothetical protein